MEEKNSEKKNKNRKIKIGSIISIIVFIVLVVIFIFLININSEDTTTKNVKSFKSTMLETYSTASGMDYEKAKQYIASETYDALDLYGGVDEVDYSANYILSLLNTDVTGNVEDLISTLTQETNNVIDDVLNGDVLNIEDDNVIRNSLSLKSNTVCSEDDIDDKFCVDNLTARTYVVDENSNKWAVIVHPFMTSGSIMYMAVGEMYTSQGFNVIAPNLRGFGGSAGSVAMGYLESLDVYDWIKDLNSNYTRYGVNSAPETIVVHGMSLGGATTLQLATNPDIAKANGGEYTSNLTDLNVKGFVDDCGYTSMTGIITGMLTMGDMTQITSLFGSLGIDEVEFMKEFSEYADKLNIEGFEDYNFTDAQVEQFETLDVLNELESFVSEFNQLEEQFNKFESGNTDVNVPGLDQSEIQDLINQFSNYDYSDIISNVTSYSASVQPKVTDNSVVINGLISQVLIEVIGVGLTEENYNLYSDSFAAGRTFPVGSKVMIIHGTGDTMVSHSNADTVATNVSPAILLKKWDVDLAPHAFVLMGTNKDEYSRLVNEFTKCVLDNNCVTIN